MTYAFLLTSVLFPYFFALISISERQGRAFIILPISSSGIFKAFEIEYVTISSSNIAVNGHRLKLYVDEDGRDGVEYPTDVGQIDILATDEGGNFVVFELKLSRGADKAMGQVSRYMG